MIIFEALFEPRKRQARRCHVFELPKHAQFKFNKNCIGES